MAVDEHTPGKLMVRQAAFIGAANGHVTGIIAAWIKVFAVLCWCWP